jgi:hypothetical protein
MISYSYDSNNEQTPIFPNTGTTNQLKGFYMVEEDTRLLVDFKIVPITNWENGTFFCNKVKKLPSGELMFSNTDLDKKLKDFEIRFRSFLRFDHRTASRLREEIQGASDELDSIGQEIQGASNEFASFMEVVNEVYRDRHNRRI